MSSADECLKIFLFWISPYRDIGSKSSLKLAAEINTILINVSRWYPWKVYLILLPATCWWLPVIRADDKGMSAAATTGRFFPLSGDFSCAGIQNPPTVMQNGPNGDSRTSFCDLAVLFHTHYSVWGMTTCGSSFRSGSWMSSTITTEQPFTHTTSHLCFSIEFFSGKPNPSVCSPLNWLQF